MIKWRNWMALAAAAATALAAGVTLQAPAMAQSSEEAEQSEAEPLDRIVLRSGRVVEGRVLEETDSAVRVMVVVAGIKAPTTYARADILKIERGVIPAPASEQGAANGSTTSKPDSRGRSEEKPAPGDAVVYHLPVQGFFVNSIGDVRSVAERRAVLSPTPMREALDDAMEHDPDVIVLELAAGAPGGLNGVFVAETIGPLIQEVIDSGTRVVFWIQRATGGVGLLPFVGPEIYFKSDGRMGGLGGIGEFEGGDEVVNQKLIAASLGIAEGMAIAGGYEPVLIRAMAREELWLAVRFRGGEPEYITFEPRPSDGEGWIVLSDDGEGDNEDEDEFEGNDVLNLDADWAYRLGVSKDTVDRLDDLVYELGVGRDYTVVKGRGQRILESWKDEIDRALDRILRLQRRLEEGGRGRGDRAEVGANIRRLQELRSILTRYAEVFDPNGAQRAQIDVRIEALRQSLRDARR